MKTDAKTPTRHNQEGIELETCEVYHIDEEKVARVSAAMISDETAVDLSALYKAMGDLTRVKIIFALSQDELCVCDIASVVGISQSAASHQLRILRNLKLVKYRKEGKIAYYSLDDEHMLHLLEEGLSHVKEPRR